MLGTFSSATEPGARRFSGRTKRGRLSDGAGRVRRERLYPEFPKHFRPMRVIVNVLQLFLDERPLLLHRQL